MPVHKKIDNLMGLIDYHEWHAVWDGCFFFTREERASNWTYEDDIDFSIACKIKRMFECR